MSVPEFASFGTTAIHAGQQPDKETGAIIPPVSISTTFAQPSPGVAAGDTFWEYSRSGNPSRAALERNFAALEGGKHGLAFSSGSMATATILHLLDAGDKVISSDDVYGGTNRYFRRIASRVANVEIEFVDLLDLEAVEKSIDERVKILWAETPSNPMLKVLDIEALAKIAKAKGVILVVDNTFASPYFQRPLSLGATIVLHSVSKYLGGHSDVIMGCTVTNDDSLKERLQFLQNGLGGIPAPSDCAMVLRSTKTLHVRMREHEKNAKAVAAFLEGHDKVHRVIYPGLKSHPQHDIATKQMTGYGGMVTFFVNGGLDGSKAFLENLKLIYLAESLGGVESLIEHPAIMTHASVPAEQRAQLGISDELCRLSVGIENVDDLIADLKQALEHVPSA